mmetsp:Transcript_12628/g.31955  ORF Transcript_12628/g.31955 Transcript_12628/m.31955 type:complete len:218 (-) Transcript_12628:114-767(-)
MARAINEDVFQLEIAEDNLIVVQKLQAVQQLRQNNSQHRNRHADMRPTHAPLEILQQRPARRKLRHQIEPLRCLEARMQLQQKRLLHNNLQNRPLLRGQPPQRGLLLRARLLHHLQRQMLPRPLMPHQIHRRKRAPPNRRQHIQLIQRTHPGHRRPRLLHLLRRNHRNRRPRRRRLPPLPAKRAPRGPHRGRVGGDQALRKAHPVAQRGGPLARDGL